MDETRYCCEDQVTAPIGNCSPAIHYIIQREVMNNFRCLSENINGDWKFCVAFVFCFSVLV